MMRKIIKRITHPFLKIGLAWYHSKPRNYSFDGVNVLVHPDVFPPYFTFSTKILLNFLKPLNLKEKSFLELGCGSGIISLYAAKKGAVATATDINPIALEYLKKAKANNKLPVEILYSKHFEKLKNRSFDYILINPPYYPQHPDSIKEQAWFCGSNFEYFEVLFEELPVYLTKDNQTFMILSQDCNLERINQIAQRNKLQLNTVEKKSTWMESNYIYRIEKSG